MRLATPRAVCLPDHVHDHNRGPDHNDDVDHRAASVNGWSGTWTGTGSDSFSRELITWVLLQSGATVPVPWSSTRLFMSMNFPAGGDALAPMSIVDLNGTATDADRQITGSYTGTDTCEGFFAHGTLALTRQP